MTPEYLSTTPDCEIRSTRIVDASIEVVYEAWANPNHLKNWWDQMGLQIHLMNSTFDQEVNGAL
jgi:uncharacterized protein YndB with AHSA1/START domain